MSVKWTGNRSESGILRKSEFKEKKEELFVFGYSCKLFRDNEKALHIDQGKHLIPWMGDETLKIDRYDARGALHDLSSLDAPPGGYDWRVELTKAELDVEQLCDEERYRALHTDEDEEEMYKEEELKRLHAAGYGQVGFNYEATQQEPEQPTPPAEIDEPFEPTTAFRALLPLDTFLPESQKQNAIIEKTAKFIASQGTQMEILIKAKQRDNPQFQFLNKDNALNSYYAALIGLVKAGKWPEKQVEVVEEKPPENEEYLHPSLASTIIESAPSIPSIHYKPSADCDYTMLISKMRGEATLDEAYVAELAPGEVPPPGTEPLPPRAQPDIQRAPVMYRAAQPPPPPVIQQAQYQQYAAYYTQQQPPPAVPAPAHAPAPAAKSTGLSLMNHYNTDSDTEDSDFDDSSSSDSKTPIATPPEDVQVVIDKMAAYVARNGDEFAEIVRAKNDPRFTFLEPNNVYHAYYKRLMQQKRGVDVNGKAKESKKKNSAPVSFSIKKLKEPDPILPKPALPYESSSDDENEKSDKAEEPKETPKPVAPQILFPVANIPPVVVYKIENQVTEIQVKPAEPVKPVIIEPKPMPVVSEPIPEVKEVPQIVEKEEKPIPRQEEIKAKSPTPDDKKYNEKRDKESPRREKRKHRERKKEYRSKSESRESKRVERSVDREKRKERDGERERKRRRYSREELDSEIISLVDTTDDLIDLTSDHDTKGPGDPSAERAKQQARRRRAAAFLQQVGAGAAATALPASSLASAMVDTLESLRKKKAEEEEKRRKREKRRHRDRYDYENGSERSHRKNKRRKNKSSDENDESDNDGTKKKKRKKEKRHSSKSKKKRRREVEIVEEEEMDHPINIDLTNTLKELRNASPTKELVQDIDDSTQHSLLRHDDSSEEEESREARRDRKRKKEEREYSEGEWSSDTEQDSGSSASRKGEQDNP